MNSDSEGDGADLAEELVNLDLDSDWEREDGDVHDSKDKQFWEWPRRNRQISSC